jgi:hypothetical protein
MLVDTIPEVSAIAKFLGVSPGQADRTCLCGNQTDHGERPNRSIQHKAHLFRLSANLFRDVADMKHDVDASRNFRFALRFQLRIR